MSGTLGWPTVTLELNTTRDPNDPGGSDTWVSIKSYATEITTRRGRTDELADVQAGTMDLALLNDAGRFDPANAGSPYYPNLRAWRQVRMLCSYSSTTYSTFRGYEETFWPQSWTEQGTKSWCKPTFVDAFAALAKIDLLDCVLMEMLADGPLALYPLSDSAGAPAAGNISSTKQSNATLQPAIVGALGTATFGAAGIVAGGSSCAQFVGPPTSDSIGPTLVLPAPAMPAFTAGLSLEFSALVSAKNTSGFGATQILRWTGPNGGEIGIYLTTAGYFTATYAPPGGGGTGIPSGIVPLPAVGTLMHIVLTMPSTRDSCNVWLNGVNVGTCSGATWNVGDLTTINIGGVSIQNGWTVNIGPIATYSTVLSSARIQAHYTAALNAFAGEVPSGHITRLLSYAAWLTALENIDTTSVGDSNSPQVGLVDIGGKNLLQALKDISNGVLADLDVDGSGKVRYRSRDARLVQTTPVYTFGEKEALGELPYTDLPETGAKPDYLYSQVQVDQVNGITALRGDATANLRYFPTTLQKTTYLQDPEMVLDLADDLLRRYKDPHERAASFVLDPASNPSLWPAVLGMDYGTRIRVMRRPANGAVKQIDCYVESISHHINFTQGVWQTTVTTSAAPPFFPWILGDATYGVLGVSTIPVF